MLQPIWDGIGRFEVSTSMRCYTAVYRHLDGGVEGAAGTASSNAHSIKSLLTYTVRRMYIASFASAMPNGMVIEYHIIFEIEFAEAIHSIWVALVRDEP